MTANRGRKVKITRDVRVFQRVGGKRSSRMELTHYFLKAEDVIIIGHPLTMVYDYNDKRVLPLFGFKGDFFVPEDELEEYDFTGVS